MRLNITGDRIRIINMDMVYPKRLLLGLVAVLALCAELPATGASSCVAEARTDPDTGHLTISYSTDGGKFWSNAVTVSKNGPSIKAYTVFTAEAPPAVLMIEHSDGLDRLFYAHAVRDGQAAEIAALENIDAADIAAMHPQAPFAVFSAGRYLYIASSVNRGRTWSSPRGYPMEVPAGEIKCALSPGMISVFTGTDSPEAIYIPSPAAPEFLTQQDIISVSGSIETEFMPSPGTEPETVMHMFEISPDREFHNPLVTTLEGSRITVQVPQDAPYGNYYCRIAAWNGLERSYSQIRPLRHLPSAKAADIDIALVKPSGSEWLRGGATAALELTVRDPQNGLPDGTEAAVLLNGVTIESFLTYDRTSAAMNGFCKIPEMTKNGANTLKVLLTDNTGNVVSTEAFISIDSVAPRIGMALMNNTIYLNTRAKIQVPMADEGAGPDLHGSTLKVFCRGVTVEGSHSQDIPSRSLVFTPAVPLGKDPYQLEIVLRDLAGNKSEKMSFALVIDEKKPQVRFEPSTYEASAATISINGTVDKKDIAKLLVQNNSSPERQVPSANGRFSATVDLVRGRNNITVTAVDLAGNRASTSAAVFLSSPPATVFFKFDDIPVSGGDYVGPSSSIRIVDESGAGIPSGTVKLDGTDVAYDTVTGNVSSGTLTEGPHIIVLSAGTGTYSLSFSVEQALRVGSVLACPSPFDPRLGNTSLTFNASKDCDVTFYVFDTSGSLVWKAAATGKTGFNNAVPWDGRSADGRALPNGVYIVRMAARDGTGGSAASSGRVILLK